LEKVIIKIEMTVNERLKSSPSPSRSRFGGARLGGFRGKNLKDQGFLDE
jgi:hypothetical protein